MARARDTHCTRWPRQPLLLSEDGPIGEYRRRARSSYSYEGDFYGDGDEHDAR